MGYLVKKNQFRNAVFNIIAWKIFYYSFALILPLIVVELPWWHIVLAFLSMHLFTGLFISLVFQVAHITPSSDFPLPDENGLIASDWSTHQFATTANFSPKSKYFSWFIGGLNYQIEHHLLPMVCHVHYKELSKIVIETAEEYGMPYSSNRTFFEAIKVHAQMIYKLGNREQKLV
jgi:linoleoyl-CoA desaturase